MKQLLQLALLLAACSPFALSQEVTAGIFGIVQDASSAVVPGATIRARNVGTGFTRETTSDESGAYSFVLIPIGVYEVTAEAQGFKKSLVNDVPLRVNDNRRIVFTMEVGQLAEQVTVEAAAVSVNVATGTTSQLLDGKDMVQLPSRGRNVLPFALLMPGVVSTTPYDRRANNSSVNGIRPTHNAWLLDGGYNVDTGGNWSTPASPRSSTTASASPRNSFNSRKSGNARGSINSVVSTCSGSAASS